MVDRATAGMSASDLVLKDWQAKRSGATMTVVGIVALGPDENAKVLISGVARIVPKNHEVVALDADDALLAVLGC